MRYKTVTNKHINILQYSESNTYYECYHQIMLVQLKGAEWRGEEEAVWHVWKSGLRPKPCWCSTAAVLQGRGDHYKPRGALQEHLWRIYQIRRLSKHVWGKARGLNAHRNILKLKHCLLFFHLWIFNYSHLMTGNCCVNAFYLSTVCDGAHIFRGSDGCNKGAQCEHWWCLWEM